MTTVDGAKEELGWLKVVFAVLAAADASLIGWIFQTYGRTNRNLLVLAVAGAALSSAVLMWLNGVAYRKIRELESLTIREVDKTI